MRPKGSLLSRSVERPTFMIIQFKLMPFEQSSKVFQDLKSVKIGSKAKFNV